MQLLRSCFVIIFFSLLYGGNAAGAYDVAYWTQVLSDINNNEYNNPSFLYSSEPDIASCDEGSLTQAAKLRAFESVNEVRKLHDLPLINYSYYYDYQAQQAAFVQLANDFLTHYPAESSACWTQAAADGSRSSNLHSSSYDSDPVENIVGWMDDANNVSTVSAVGHRRWMINPFLEYVTYGQTNGPAALKVMSFDNEPSTNPLIDVDYVAFPYQKYPYIFFSDGSNGKRTPWSFTVIENKTWAWGNQSNYFSNAEVTVTNTNTAESLAITDIYTDSTGYGVPNIITWSAQDWEYDTWYSVEISNVAMQDGSMQDYVYDVYIDYSGLIDITRPLETGDNINGTTITGDLHDDSDEDTYEVRLYGDTTITGSSQYSNMAFFITLYDSSKQIVYSSDSSFSLYLDNDIYTLQISNCKPSVGCYSGSKQYSISMTPPLPSPNQALIEDFIERLFINILGRSADSDGLAYWSNLIQIESAVFVAQGFFDSQEFDDLALDNDVFVDILYQTLFDRDADAGKDHWLSQLQSGALRDMVLYGFFLSQEFADLAERFSVTDFSDDDNALYQMKQFIVRFYQMVLNREAEVGGYNYWVDQLSSDARSAGDIARNFFFSNEFINQGHNDSTFIDIAYQTLLNRNADQDGREYWQGQLNSGMTRLELVNGFIGSTEFAGIASDYGIRVN